MSRWDVSIGEHEKRTRREVSSAAQRLIATDSVSSDLKDGWSLERSSTDIKLGSVGFKILLCGKYPDKAPKRRVTFWKHYSKKYIRFKSNTKKIKQKHTRYLKRSVRIIK